MNNAVLQNTPAVFAVGDSYQIMVPVKKETLMWVCVGDRCFYDHVNGTLRSATAIHRMTVPRQLLDTHRGYTICYRVITERKPYFTQSENEAQLYFSFLPVSEQRAKAFFIADTHNDAYAPVEAAKAFEKKYGSIDFLILAGDIPNDSGCVENFSTIYEIIEATTQGRKPVVYAKGNHDLRGICAEKMDEYTPIFNGNTYFSFRLGNIWGLCLDCGEDKADDHAEYGHTVCCHAFREAETEFIRQVIRNADREYGAENVAYKLIVVHNPFSQVPEPPFDIEQEIYGQWCSFLREQIKPDLMICGHLHELEVNEPGGEKDHLGQPCRVIVGAKPFTDEETCEGHFIGTGLMFANSTIQYRFIDDTGKEY